MYRKLLAGAAIAVIAVAIVGCAQTREGAQEKCGGESAGISFEESGALVYKEDRDSTGEAWTCLLRELVPGEAEQYAITQGLRPGEGGEISAGGYDVVFGMNPSGQISLYFND